MALHEVRFVPSDKVVRAHAGTTLLHAAHLAGIPIGSSCEGKGACAWCRVIVVTGAEFLSPPSQQESALARKHQLASDERIACLCTINGSVSIATEYWGYQRRLQVP